MAHQKDVIQEKVLPIVILMKGKVSFLLSCNVLWLVLLISKISRMSRNVKLYFTSTILKVQCTQQNYTFITFKRDWCCSWNISLPERKMIQHRTPALSFNRWNIIFKLLHELLVRHQAFPVEHRCLSCQYKRKESQVLTNISKEK
jgi:hypothetical protein